MNKLTTIALIAFINILLAGIITPAAFASELATNSVSGVIFNDLNGNGMQEMNETSISHGIINVQEMGSDVIESLIADADGTFNTGEMAFGTYLVWSEANGQASEMVMLEINELSASTVLALGIPSATVAIDGAAEATNIDSDMEMVELQTILLPVIMN